MLLVVGFLAVIFGVPAGQVALELCRGERAQFTDLFRYAPTEANLRRFESTLEEHWWGQATVRPWMQRLEFLTLRNMGAKAIMGRDGWVFYRPGVQYLIQANRAGDVIDAIVRYRDQLRRRGIELLVAPVPGKASVYPDKLTQRAEGKEPSFRSPTEDLLEGLGQRGVQTVDLFALFREARSSRSDTCYLATDTHWTPSGAKLAAEAVARKLGELRWAPAARREYRTQRVAVRRWGDIPEMTQIPGIRERFAPEAVECEQVLDGLVGPMIAGPGGRDGTYANTHLIDTALESAVLVLGDSFSRIYQLPEPRSLGEVLGGAAESKQPRGRQPVGTKRPLPGSAGFPSLLARALKAPVDYIASDGGAATDVRQRLSVNAEILRNKRVVVWEFAERDVALGAAGWEDVPLPPGP